MGEGFDPSSELGLVVPGGASQGTDSNGNVTAIVSSILDAGDGSIDTLIGAQPLDLTAVQILSITGGLDYTTLGSQGYLGTNQDGLANISVSSTTEFDTIFKSSNPTLNEILQGSNLLGQTYYIGTDGAHALVESVIVFPTILADIVGNNGTFVQDAVLADNPFITTTGTTAVNFTFDTQGATLPDDSVTLDQDNAQLAPTANTDTIVTGNGNTVALAANTRLTVSGNDNTISAQTDSVIAVDPGASNTIIDGAANTLVFYRGYNTVPYGGGGLVNNVSANETIVVQNAAADVSYDHIFSPGPGVQSVAISTRPDNGNASDYSLNYQTFSGANQVGRLDSFVFLQNGNEIDYHTEFGGYGIYQTTFITDPTGGMISTETDYVAPTADGGLQLLSEIKYGGSSTMIPSGAYSRVDFYSGAYLGGHITSSTVDYNDSSSSFFTPSGGAYGIYQIETHYNAVDLGGAVVRTTYDYVSPTASGGYTAKSISLFTGNGTNGIVNTEIDTDQANEAGHVSRVILDSSNGQSTTYTPTFQAPGSETMTVWSGLDGTGNVISTTTVTAGTAATQFNQDTQGATFPTSATVTSMSLADFAATRSSSAAAVTPVRTDALATVGSPLTTTAPAASPLLIQQQHLSQIPTRHA